MRNIHCYQGQPINFFDNMISVYDLFVALSINNRRLVFDEITKQKPLRFGDYKFVRLQNANGEIETRIFINSRQIVVVLHFLKTQRLIEDFQEFNFNLWYTDIVDRGIEYWVADRKEEKIQDQLVLLAGYGTIKLTQEVTVLALPDSQEKTRRYDLVEYMKQTNIVKIRELKSRKITVRDIEITLDQKGYLTIARERWPQTNIDLIFTSLEGIEEEAELLIDQIQGVSFEDVRDLGLRLYMNALKNTPREGWTYFQLNVASKFLEVLPSPPVLREAEDSL